MELTADPAGYTEEVVRVGHTGEEAAGLDGHTEADPGCTEVVQVVLAHIAAAGLLVEQTAGDLELELDLELEGAAWVSESPPLLAVIFWALLPIN